MAPLSVFACYAYKNGGCRLSEDACRFPHAISDPSSQYLQRRRKLSQLATDETELIGILDRDLAPEDVPIAEAAAKAGFDCSNWLKLKGLINAVRAVKAPVTYPDRWNGPAAFRSSIYPDRWTAAHGTRQRFQSSIYPDRWTAAHGTRQRKVFFQSYRDAERVPSVPAYVVSAAQNLRNINNWPPVRGTAGAPAIRGTGSNRIPLRPISGNKRGGIDLLSSSPKRTKTEQPLQPSSNIDLPKDNKLVEYIPIHRPHPRQVSTNTTKTAYSLPSNSQHETRQRTAKDRMSHESVQTLAQIASKLRASAHALDVDRATLRQRWESDEKLQLQTVTDHLRDLNESFGRAEDGIGDALDVIEKRLL